MAYCSAFFYIMPVIAGFSAHKLSKFASILALRSASATPTSTSYAHLTEPLKLLAYVFGTLNFYRINSI